MTEPQLSMSLPSFAAEAPGSWRPMLDMAQAMDRAGVDRLWVSDHVVFGERLDEYARPEVGGTRGGVQPTGPDGHWLEPLTTLSVVAGCTSRIRLGTAILIAALRRPVVLAKTTSTLDVLSEGRLDMGVGVGWQREEYEAAGLAFDGRGAILDRSLEVCQALWRTRVAAHDDPDLRFEAIHMMPKPVQPGGVPVWVSGRVHRRIARRIARFGSGWIPWGDDQAHVAAGIAAMRKELDALGYDHTNMSVAGGLKAVQRDDGTVDLPATMAEVPELAAAGVTDFRCRFPLPEDPSALADFLGEAVATFRNVAGRPAHTP